MSLLVSDVYHFIIKMLLDSFFEPTSYIHMPVEISNILGYVLFHQMAVCVANVLVCTRQKLPSMKVLCHIKGHLS